MSATPYERAIRALDVAVIASADTGDYQGDWIALIGDTSGYGTPHRWGLLVIGYGSCSGCDAWDGSGSAAERLTDLLGNLNATTWHDTFDAARAYINHPDREGSFYFNGSGWADFLTRVNAADEDTRETATPVRDAT